MFLSSGLLGSLGSAVVLAFIMIAGLALDWSHKCRVLVLLGHLGCIARDRGPLLDRVCTPIVAPRRTECQNPIWGATTAVLMDDIFAKRGSLACRPTRTNEIRVNSGIMP